MEDLRRDVAVGLRRNVRRISRAGSLSCELCTAERFDILRGMFTGELLMNLREEVFTKCRHPPKFAKWEQKRDTFTDDPMTGENT